MLQIDVFLHKHDLQMISFITGDHLKPLAIGMKKQKFFYMFHILFILLKKHAHTLLFTV